MLLGQLVWGEAIGMRAWEGAGGETKTAMQVEPHPTPALFTVKVGKLLCQGSGSEYFGLGRSYGLCYNYSTCKRMGVAMCQ